MVGSDGLDYMKVLVLLSFLIFIFIGSIMVYDNIRSSDCPGTIMAAAFEYEYNNGTLYITHDGGDTFKDENTRKLYVTVTNSTVKEFDLPYSPGDTLTITTIKPGDMI